MQTRAEVDFDAVVLVADLFDETRSWPVHKRRDLEMTDQETLAAVTHAIGELGLKVHHYGEPAELARNADRHRNDLVWAIYGGESSRNRMALVPAICESFHLRYVGPDAYGRVIAQDKEISKRLALDAGLFTPAWRLMRGPSDAKHLRGLKLPIVVKPNLEGSSIGLSQRNIARTMDDAINLATELHRDLNQAILLEEFAVGREVAYSRIESTNQSIWAFSEIAMKGDPAYFETRLFDAEEKFYRKPERFVQLIDEMLRPEDQAAIENFLASFGHYGYCRVDGRLIDKQFCFLEMTPDAWIAPAGQLADSLMRQGRSYTDVIRDVLASAALAPRTR